MKRARRVVFLALGALLIVIPARPETNVIAPFVQKGAGGRPTGMGDCFTAVAEGPFGQLYNPAGLGLESAACLGFQHESGAMGVKQESLAARFPVGPGSLGAVIAYWFYGALEGRDESGQLSGQSLNLNEGRYGLGYGMPLSEHWRLGASLGMYSLNLGTVQHGGPLLDLGGAWDPGEDFSVAAVVKSLGAPQQGFGLPTSLRCAGAYRAFERRLLMDVELDVPFSRTTADFGLGAEFRLWEWFDLRAGFKMPFGAADAAVESLILGLGFNLQSFGLDLAFVGRGDLGTEASATLVYALGSPRAEPFPQPKLQAAVADTEALQDALRRLEEAKRESSRRIALDTDRQAQYHFQAGQEYERYGQIIDAIIEYKAALQVKPNYRAAQKALASAKAKARTEAEAAEAQEAKTRAEDSKSSVQELIRKYYERGEAAYRKGDYATAIKNLQLVLELTSKHKQATELLAKARSALNQEVDRLYKEGVDLYAQGELRNALKSFEDLLKLKPDHAKAKDALKSIKEKLLQTGQ